MKVGLIEKLPYDVVIREAPGSPITWWHNFTICHDDKNNVWAAVRCHDKLPLTVHLEPNSPYREEASFFYVGKLDPDTLEVTGLKLIVPEDGSPDFLLKHNIEDVRIYHRHDGLRGIGVIFPNGHVTQGEILIDYDNGTYKLVHDYGQPHKHTEKNWSPPSQPTEAFDFIYSQTQVIKYGKPRGTSVYEGEIHGGSQLLPYKDGWISIAHRVMPIVGLTWRWYMTIAQLHDYRGTVTHHSQYFDFGTGWRENLQESVEYVSGAIWTKDQEELLLSLGVRDETCGFVRIPISAFKWHKPQTTFTKFEIDESLKKIVKEHAGQKPIQGFVL
jgi:hypothetical protein